MEISPRSSINKSVSFSQFLSEELTEADTPQLLVRGSEQRNSSERQSSDFPAENISDRHSDIHSEFDRRVFRIHGPVQMKGGKTSFSSKGGKTPLSSSKKTPSSSSRNSSSLDLKSRSSGSLDLKSRPSGTVVKSQSRSSGSSSSTNSSSSTDSKSSVKSSSSKDSKTSVTAPSGTQNHSENDDFSKSGTKNASGKSKRRTSHDSSNGTSSSKSVGASRSSTSKTSKNDRSSTSKTWKSGTTSSRFGTDSKSARFSGTSAVRSSRRVSRTPMEHSVKLSKREHHHLVGQIGEGASRRHSNKHNSKRKQHGLESITKQWLDVYVPLEVPPEKQSDMRGRSLPNRFMNPSPTQPTVEELRQGREKHKQESMERMFQMAKSRIVKRKEESEKAFKLWELDQHRNAVAVKMHKTPDKVTTDDLIKGLPHAGHQDKIEKVNDRLYYSARDEMKQSADAVREKLDQKLQDQIQKSHQDITARRQHYEQLVKPKLRLPENHFDTVKNRALIGKNRNRSKSDRSADITPAPIPPALRPGYDELNFFQKYDAELTYRREVQKYYQEHEEHVQNTMRIEHQLKLHESVDSYMRAAGSDVVVPEELDPLHRTHEEQLNWVNMVHEDFSRKKLEREELFFQKKEDDIQKAMQYSQELEMSIAEKRSMGDSYTQEERCEILYAESFERLKRKRLNIEYALEDQIDLEEQALAEKRDIISFNLQACGMEQVSNRNKLTFENLYKDSKRRAVDLMKKREAKDIETQGFISRHRKNFRKYSNAKYQIKCGEEFKNFRSNFSSVFDWLYYKGSSVSTGRLGEETSANTNHDQKVLAGAGNSGKSLIRTGGVYNRLYNDSTDRSARNLQRKIARELLVERLHKHMMVHERQRRRSRSLRRIGRFVSSAKKEFRDASPERRMEISQKLQEYKNDLDHTVAAMVTDHLESRGKHEIAANGLFKKEVSSQRERIATRKGSLQYLPNYSGSRNMQNPHREDWKNFLNDSRLGGSNPLAVSMPHLGDNSTFEENDLTSKHPHLHDSAKEDIVKNNDPSSDVKSVGDSRSGANLAGDNQSFVNDPASSEPESRLGLSMTREKADGDTDRLRGKTLPKQQPSFLNLRKSQSHKALQFGNANVRQYDENVSSNYREFTNSLSSSGMFRYGSTVEANSSAKSALLPLNNSKSQLEMLIDSKAQSSIRRSQTLKQRSRMYPNASSRFRSLGSSKKTANLNLTNGGLSKDGSEKSSTTSKFSGETKSISTKKPLRSVEQIQESGGAKIFVNGKPLNGKPLNGKPVTTAVVTSGAASQSLRANYRSRKPIVNANVDDNLVATFEVNAMIAKIASVIKDEESRHDFNLDRATHNVLNILASDPTIVGTGGFSGTRRFMDNIEESIEPSESVKTSDEDKTLSSVQLSISNASSAKVPHPLAPDSIATTLAVNVKVGTKAWFDQYLKFEEALGGKYGNTAKIAEKLVLFNSSGLGHMSTFEKFRHSRHIAFLWRQHLQKSRWLSRGELSEQYTQHHVLNPAALVQAQRKAYLQKTLWKIVTGDYRYRDFVVRGTLKNAGLDAKQRPLNEILVPIYEKDLEIIKMVAGTNFLGHLIQDAEDTRSLETRISKLQTDIFGPMEGIEHSPTTASKTKKARGGAYRIGAADALGVNGGDGGVMNLHSEGGVTNAAAHYYNEKNIDRNADINENGDQMKENGVNEKDDHKNDNMNENGDHMKENVEANGKTIDIPKFLTIGGSGTKYLNYEFPGQEIQWKIASLHSSKPFITAMRLGVSKRRYLALKDAGGTNGDIGNHQLDHVINLTKPGAPVDTPEAIYKSIHAEFKNQYNRFKSDQSNLLQMNQISPAALVKKPPISLMTLAGDEIMLPEEWYSEGNTLKGYLLDVDDNFKQQIKDRQLEKKEEASLRDLEERDMRHIQLFRSHISKKDVLKLGMQRAIEKSVARVKTIGMLRQMGNMLSIGGNGKGPRPKSIQSSSAKKSDAFMAGDADASIAVATTHKIASSKARSISDGKSDSAGKRHPMPDFYFPTSSGNTSSCSSSAVDDDDSTGLGYTSNLELLSNIIPKSVIDIVNQESGKKVLEDRQKKSLRSLSPHHNLAQQPIHPSNEHPRPMGGDLGLEDEDPDSPYQIRRGTENRSSFFKKLKHQKDDFLDKRDAKRKESLLDLANMNNSDGFETALTRRQCENPGKHSLGALQSVFNKRNEERLERQMRRRQRLKEEENLKKEKLEDKRYHDRANRYFNKEKRQHNRNQRGETRSPSRNTEKVERENREREAMAVLNLTRRSFSGMFGIDVGSKQTSAGELTNIAAHHSKQTGVGSKQTGIDSQSAAKSTAHPDQSAMYQYPQRNHYSTGASGIATRHVAASVAQADLSSADSMLVSGNSNLKNTQDTIGEVDFDRNGIDAMKGKRLRQQSGAKRTGHESVSRSMDLKGSLKGKRVLGQSKAFAAGKGQEVVPLSLPGSVAGKGKKRSQSSGQGLSKTPKAGTSMSKSLALATGGEHSGVSTYGIVNRDSVGASEEAHVGSHFSIISNLNKTGKILPIKGVEQQQSSHQHQSLEQYQVSTNLNQPQQQWSPVSSMSFIMPQELQNMTQAAMSLAGDLGLMNRPDSMTRSAASPRLPTASPPLPTVSSLAAQFTEEVSMPVASLSTEPELPVPVSTASIVPDAASVAANVPITVVGLSTPAIPIADAAPRQQDHVIDAVQQQDEQDLDAQDNAYASQADPAIHFEQHPAKLSSLPDGKAQGKAAVKKRGERAKSVLMKSLPLNKRLSVPAVKESSGALNKRSSVSSQGKAATKSVGLAKIGPSGVGKVPSNLPTGRKSKSKRSSQVRGVSTPALNSQPAARDSAAPGQESPSGQADADFADADTGDVDEGPHALGNEHSHDASISARYNVRTSAAEALGRDEVDSSFVSENQELSATVISQALDGRAFSDQVDGSAAQTAVCEVSAGSQMVRQVEAVLGPIVPRNSAGPFADSPTVVSGDYAPLVESASTRKSQELEESHVVAGREGEERAALDIIDQQQSLRQNSANGESSLSTIQQDSILKEQQRACLDVDTSAEENTGPSATIDKPVTFFEEGQPTLGGSGPVVDTLYERQQGGTAASANPGTVPGANQLGIFCEGSSSPSSPSSSSLQRLSRSKMSSQDTQSNILDTISNLAANVQSNVFHDMAQDMQSDANDSSISSPKRNSISGKPPLPYRPRGSEGSSTAGSAMSSKASVPKRLSQRESIRTAKRDSSSISLRASGTRESQAQSTAASHQSHVEKSKSSSLSKASMVSSTRRASLPSQEKRLSRSDSQRIISEIGTSGVSQPPVVGRISQAIPARKSRASLARAESQMFARTASQKRLSIGDGASSSQVLPRNSQSDSGESAGLRSQNLPSGGRSPKRQASATSSCSSRLSSHSQRALDAEAKYKHRMKSAAEKRRESEKKKDLNPLEGINISIDISALEAEMKEMQKEIDQKERALEAEEESEGLGGFGDVAHLGSGLTDATGLTGWGSGGEHEEAAEDRSSQSAAMAVAEEPDQPSSDGIWGFDAGAAWGNELWGGAEEAKPPTASQKSKGRSSLASQESGRSSSAASQKSGKPSKQMGRSSQEMGRSSTISGKASKSNGLKSQKSGLSGTSSKGEAARSSKEMARSSKGMRPSQEGASIGMRSSKGAEEPWIDSKVDTVTLNDSGPGDDSAVWGDIGAHGFATRLGGFTADDTTEPNAVDDVTGDATVATGWGGWLRDPTDGQAETTRDGDKEPTTRDGDTAQWTGAPETPFSSRSGAGETETPADGKVLGVVEKKEKDAVEVKALGVVEEEREKAADVVAESVVKDGILEVGVVDENPTEETNTNLLAIPSGLGAAHAVLSPRPDVTEHDTTVKGNVDKQPAREELVVEERFEEEEVIVRDVEVTTPTEEAVADELPTEKAPAEEASWFGTAMQILTLRLDGDDAQQGGEAQENDATEGQTSSIGAGAGLQLPGLQLLSPRPDTGAQQNGNAQEESWFSAAIAVLSPRPDGDLEEPTAEVPLIPSEPMSPPNPTIEDPVAAEDAPVEESSPTEEVSWFDAGMQLLSPRPDASAGQQGSWIGAATAVLSPRPEAEIQDNDADGQASVDQPPEEQPSWFGGAILSPRPDPTDLQEAPAGEGTVIETPLGTPPEPEEPTEQEEPREQEEPAEQETGGSLSPRSDHEG